MEMNLQNIKAKYEQEAEKNRGKVLLEESYYKHIDFIVIEELKELVLTSLEKYGTKEKLNYANDVAEILTGLLRKKKLLDEHTHQSFVDILLSATLLHNLFYDENDWTTLFLARKELQPIASEMKINHQALEALFSTIEGQLGEDTPVSDCIPKPGTPTELFSYAIWFANYNKGN